MGSSCVTTSGIGDGIGAATGSSLWQSHHSPGSIPFLKEPDRLIKCYDMAHHPKPFRYLMVALISASSLAYYVIFLLSWPNRQFKQFPYGFPHYSSS